MYIWEGHDPHDQGSILSSGSSRYQHIQTGTYSAA
jgi:hypothetical protein